MDWTALLRHVSKFARDEQGGESVEYALTSLVALATAAVSQRAMTCSLSALAARSLDLPAPAE